VKFSSPPPAGIAEAVGASTIGLPKGGTKTDISYTRSLEDVEATEWRRLATDAGHVFATPEWLLTWWRHFGKERRQLIGLARAEAKLVAVVPLCESWTHGVHVLRFVGHGQSDQLGPVSAPLSDPVAASTVRAVIGGLPLQRFILFAERIPGDQRLTELGSARFLYREASPVLQGSWDDFLRTRGRNFRQQVRRFPRKLAELGTVSYRLASDPERLDQDLDTLFRLHRRRWEGAATSFLRAARFHRDFAAEAFRRDWLRLWFLEIDGAPVAALLGFRFAGVEAAYQSGRDPTLQQHPLGFVLLAHAARTALDDGMREYRLGRGGDPYKNRFATADPTLATYGLARGGTARVLLTAAPAQRGRSLGLRRILA
jgi:CelD/BcsL family acetyltransferase involved in cellulose biosynthesis